MDTQNRTSRSEGLDKIIESMYTPVTEGKSHNCATHVEHSKWGKGECIAEGHAEPDENGNVAWYNVIFEHGTEKVNTDDVKVVKSSHHVHPTLRGRPGHSSHKPSRTKKKKKVNETDDWANRRIDHSANPRKRIKISPGAGEAYLKRKQAEAEAEGWERCPHECYPDREGTFRHHTGEICPECEGRGFVAPDHISPGERPATEPRDVEIPGDAARDHGLYASVKTSDQIVEDDSLDAWNAKMQGEEGFQIGDFVDIDDPDDEYASQAEWVVVQVEGDSVTVAKVDENDVRTLPAQNVTRTGGGSTSQVSSMLDDAAGGDFMSYLNKIEFDDRGAAALVEWLARYNLGAS